MKYLYLLCLIFLFFACNPTPRTVYIAYGPWLQEVTQNSIKVMWASSSRRTSTVQFGTTQNLGNSVSGSYDQPQTEAIYVYTATLNNLSPDTKYYYRVIVSSDTSDVYYFYTAADDPYFNFVVWSDAQHATGHSLVADDIGNIKPDFVVNVGDMVSDSDEWIDWTNEFLNYAAEYLPWCPYFPAQGNHENDYTGWAYFQELFEVPENGQQEKYYFFDYGNARFFVLSTYMGYNTIDDQRIWFEAVCDTTNKDWKFAFFHEPLIASCDSVKIDDTGFSRLEPLLREYNFDLVFSGHAHIYERSLKDSVYHIVTGGGGADNIPVNVNPNPWQVYAQSTRHVCYLEIADKQLDFWAINSSGVTIDSFTINKTAGPQLSFSPDTLDFGRSASSLNLIISNTGSDTLFWSASENSGWISSISPATGTPDTVLITINRAALTEGVQFASISLTSNGGSASVPVRAEKYVSRATISVTPDSLFFETFVDSTPAQQTCIVSNSGDSVLSWTASENINWLSLSDTSGSDNDSIRVFVDSDSLTAGNYSGSIKISDLNSTNDSVLVSILFTLNSNTGEIGEFEAESSSDLPNAGWTATTNNGSSCLVAAVNAYTLNQAYRIDFDFDVPPGVSKVYVFAEVDINNSDGDDSFWIGVNSDWCQWKNLNDFLGDGWSRAWVYHAPNAESQHEFTVSAGTNTLSLAPRVNGAFVNWIVVTENEDLNIENFAF